MYSSSIIFWLYSTLSFFSSSSFETCDEVTCSIDSTEASDTFVVTSSLPQPPNTTKLNIPTVNKLTFSFFFLQIILFLYPTFQQFQKKSDSPYNQKSYQASLGII